MIYLLKLFNVLLITVLFNTANAALITHELTVNPYQVCFNGVDCSDTSMIENGDLERYSDDFFSAVGLDIQFGEISVLNFDTSGGESFYERFDLYPTLAGLGADHQNYTSVPAFFEYSDIDSIYGLGWLGSAGISVNLISDYIDNMVTFIHEIGHNLGLDHYFDFGIGATNNFMDYTACGHECTIADTQIEQIRASFAQGEFAFVHEIVVDDSSAQIPEPSSILLFLIALLFLLARYLFWGRAKVSPFLFN